MNIIPIKKRQKDLHNFKRQIANASYCSQIYDNSFTSQTRILFKNQHSLLVAVLLFIHLHSNYQGMHLSPQNVSSHNTAVNILHTLIIRPPFGPTKLVLIVKRSLKKEGDTFKIDVLDQERWFKFNNRLSLILRGLNSKDYCTCIT